MLAPHSTQAENLGHKQTLRTKLVINRVTRLGEISSFGLFFKGPGKYFWGIISFVASILGV
jgi:hypothetical protein